MNRYESLKTIPKVSQIQQLGISKKAVVVLIGNIQYNFLVSRIMDSVPKTFMSIQYIVWHIVLLTYSGCNVSVAKHLIFNTHPIDFSLLFS